MPRLLHSVPLATGFLFFVSARFTAAATPPEVDPRGLAIQLESSTLTVGDRFNVIEKLKAMGPSARSAVPVLCKLLTRKDLSADGQTTLGQETAGVLAHISVEACNTAVVAARDELAAVSPDGYPTTDWVHVLAALGPLGVPALAEATADPHPLAARTASQALRLDAIQNQRDPAKTAALAKIGPKLALGWSRAVDGDRDQKPRQSTPDQPFAQQQQQREKQRWIEEVNEIAELSGPAAFDTVAATAGAYARRHRAEPATAATAVKELQRVIAATPPKQVSYDPVVDQALRKVIACNDAAIAPLAEMISQDAQARSIGIFALNTLIGPIPRGRAVDPFLSRRRLMQCMPPSVLPLDPQNRAAMAKAVAALSKIADDLNPDGQNPTPAAALSILTQIAPDVPAAAAALISEMNRVSDMFVVQFGDALGRCDPATRKKVALEAKTPTGLNVALRASLRNRAPKDAAALIIAKIPPASRKGFVNDLENESAPSEVAPLLLELLTDESSDALTVMMSSGPDQFAAILLAALDRPEPKIRAGAFTALPDRDISLPVIVKAANSLGDDLVSPSASGVLLRAGPIAFASLIEQTRSKTAVIRSRAADVIAAIPSTTAYEESSAQDKSNLAMEVTLLWDDPEVAVRASALVATAHFLDIAKPALVERLKQADEQQRIRLAEGLLSTVKPNSNTDIGYEQIADAKARLASHRKLVPAALAPSPAEMFGDLAISGDTASANSAEEVLIRAEVISMDRFAAEALDRARTKSAAIFDAAKSADPVVRAKAIDDAANVYGLSELVFAGLSDPDPLVRVEAMRAIDSALSECLAGAPAALVKTMDLAQTDPVRQVRGVAQFSLDMLHRDSLGHLMPRLRLLSRSHDEQQRAIAARVYGEMIDPREPISTNGRHADREEFVQVTRMLDDPSALVRRSAGISLVSFIRPAEPQAPAVATLLKCLENTTALDSDAKAAMLEVVPALAGARVAGLLNHPDPDVKIAAELGAEQRTGLPITRNPRVPAADAINALSSPVRSIRRMAAQSLLIQDPADATRTTQGTTALLLARNDTHEPIAIDALDILVRSYCGPAIGPGVNTFKEYPQQRMRVTHFPTPYEVAVQKLMDRTVTGTVQNRLAAIAEVAAGGPKSVAARWDVFAQLLEDDDPQIRASAFSVARSATEKAVTDQLPAAAAAAAAASKK